MPAQPLTHHDILGLVAPFARRGRHVDLAASDRMARRLIFKPVAHADEAAAWAGTETLQLDQPRSDAYRLIRTLAPRIGAPAMLRTDGPDPGELLARIEAVPPQRQFCAIGNVVIAQSYRLEPDADASAPLRLVLTSAEARLDGLTLVLQAETGRGYPAEIALESAPGRVLDLPDDLLATLGWDWRVLRRRGTGWTGSLRVRGREPARSRRIETRLAGAVAHLAKTLAEPPHRFHERLARARWTVVVRRAIPLLLCIAMIAGTAGLTFLDIPTDSMIQMLIFNLPPLLMLVLFGMRELPRFEIPPLPRPSAATAWQPPERSVATPDLRSTG